MQYRELEKKSPSPEKLAADGKWTVFGERTIQTVLNEF